MATEEGRQRIAKAREALEQKRQQEQAAKEGDGEGRLIGCRNVGFVRGICGTIIPEEAVIYCQDGLVRHNEKGEVVDAGHVRLQDDRLVAAPSEVERYLADWPIDFEPVYE